jgi:hypothetical protein
LEVGLSDTVAFDLENVDGLAGGALDEAGDYGRGARLDTESIEGEVAEGGVGGGVDVLDGVDDAGSGAEIGGVEGGDAFGGAVGGGIVESDGGAAGGGVGDGEGAGEAVEGVDGGRASPAPAARDAGGASEVAGGVER